MCSHSACEGSGLSHTDMLRPLSAFMMNLSNENDHICIINHEETRDSSDIEETLFIFIQTFVLLYTLLLLFLHPVFMTYLHQKLGGNNNREKNQFVVRIVKKRVPACAVCGSEDGVKQANK